MKRLLTSAAIISVLATSSAVAAVEATATTDLNLRAGPGPEFEVVDVIGGQDAVTITSCVAAGSWCRVSYNGTDGWAYSGYLTASLQGEPVMVVDNVPTLEIETVDGDEVRREAAAGSALVGGIAGALLAGPAGAIAGAAAAGGAAAISVPDEDVTYIRENRLEPVYLEGEVVRGAVVPEEVELMTIPDSNYAYLYINGVPAVIDPADRSIVHIVRR